jgi:hypothetical protein
MQVCEKFKYLGIVMINQNYSYHLFEKHCGNGFRSYLYETCFCFQCSNEFFAPSLNHKSTYFYVVLACGTNLVVGDMLSYVLTCSQLLFGAHFGCRRMPFSFPGISLYTSSLSCTAVIICFWPDF